MQSGVRAAVALSACLLMAGAIGAARVMAPVNLTGQWELNRDLSSAPGGLPGPDGGGRSGGGRGPGGGGGGGRIGGGFGGRGGGRGAGMGGGPGATRPSAEDMEAQRALMQEVAELPSRVTITQDGDKVMFVERDGVVRRYLANGKTEKHQLTHGTIETKSSWDNARLKMEITVGRSKLVRTFGLRENPRRLEVSTSFEGAPKDARQLNVYDETGVRSQDSGFSPDS